ncbi:DUF4190 domain-containing protein [Nocardia mexicana]|uniref:DUF4190 domain-containing protein n=1 Tax=Nocardia mexicana TaxID=279262 RepID=A0A370H4K3_9NOCA|nr:DUF4190 domain-containing protein [Nocardia mexicana]RDI51093.1 hypothetical protein DFR68_105570 [Nocardia mexicana]
MTYGPPPEPADPAWQPGPSAGYSAPAAPGQHVQNAPHQQPWANPGGQGWQGGPQPAERRPGIGLAVGAVLLGLVGCVLPLLPIDLTGIRPLVGLPFGLAGLVLGIVGCTGQRTGKGLAIAGIFLSTLALAVAVIMLPQAM